MIWKNIPFKLIFANGKVLIIVFDDVATEHHFGGQPIYWIVDVILNKKGLP
jgi:hypothetical protein